MDKMNEFTQEEIDTATYYVYLKRLRRNAHGDAITDREEGIRALRLQRELEKAPKGCMM